MLYEIIIPRFQKENSTEHTLRLVGKDLDTFIEMVKNDLVMKEIIRKIYNGDEVPTNEERDVIEIAIIESIKQEKEKILTIPKDFYKDIKYDVDIDITGESIDTRVRQATIFSVLQAVTSDPTMTQDPVKKKILYMMLENGGINPSDIFDVEKKDINLIQPEGMGMSLPRGSGGGVSSANLEQAIPGMANKSI